MNRENSTFIMPKIETNRFYLRILSHSDAEQIFAYAKDPDVSKFLSWSAHENISDTKEFIKAALDAYVKKLMVVWVIESKDEKKVIGTISLINFYPSHACCEVGYALSKDYWGKGIMSEVLSAVTKFCFEEILINRIEAHSFVHNIASQQVLKKCGYKYEGTLREKMIIKEKFIDLKIFSLLRNEFMKTSSN